MQLLLFVVFIAEIFCQNDIPLNSSNVDLVKQNVRVSQVSGNFLATNRWCKNDIENFCIKKGLSNTQNIEVLHCIDDLENAANLIDKRCQNVIYRFRYGLTKNIRFDSASMILCKNDLKILDDCSEHMDEQGTGRLISCLHDRIEQINDLTCRNFIVQLESMIFTDWRFSEFFTGSCINDITKFQCGRLDLENETLPHEQAAVISCLMQKKDDLSAACSKGIDRITEMQSNDFHLDRKLYFACREDQQRFCAKSQPGNGQIYRCLYQQKFNALMSSSCRAEIQRRQKLVISNIKLDAPFMKACKIEIDEHKCTQADGKQSGDVKLVKMLLCLEERRKKGQTINEQCAREMLVHRQMLFSDFHLSPEIVSSCRSVIISNCSSLTDSISTMNRDQRAGRMVHCLLNAARLQKNIEPTCLNAIKSLVRAVNPAADIRADPFLEKTCRPVISSLCSNIKPGSGKVVECLLQNLNNIRMTEDCQDLLMDLAYFTHRDWRLTPLFVSLCRKDLESFCLVPKNWSMSDNVDPKGLSKLLHCLYQQRNEIKSECRDQVKKIMTIRSQSVGLVPEIEDTCMNDLSTCSKVTRKGEEIHCLQERYLELEPDCQNAVKKFTKASMSDASLDFYLVKSCENIIQLYCSKGNEEESDLLRCLFKYKNDVKMPANCRSSIEFHQITSLKDRAFLSERFKKSCQSELKEHCQNAKEKEKIIECLGEIVLRDSLAQKTNRIGALCRNELKFELLQRSESIKLDPALSISCRVDIQKFCSKVPPGNAQVLDCLKRNDDELTSGCLLIVRKRAKIEVLMPKNDYGLTAQCGALIQKFCTNEKEQNLLICLRKHINDEKVTTSCRNTLLYRLMIYNTDARFNKDLIESCRQDIFQHCPNMVDRADDDDETLVDKSMSGRLINCLRSKYGTDKKLISAKCGEEIVELIKSSKKDIRLDAQLYENCRLILQRSCPGPNKEDCLKLLFQKNRIDEERCRKQIIRIIQEGKADIHTDPSLIIACQQDVSKFCIDVPIGDDRQIQCLLKKRKSLSKNCAETLESRQQIWKQIPELKDFPNLTRVLFENAAFLQLLFVFVIFNCLFFCFCWFCRALSRRKLIQKHK